ncbi:hypothetical protein SAMN05444401_3562 [Clostridium amylolyticum]|uniref:Uncharacterized protein n=1 Tax=Clostridium amylolyticum TaxID=1121298 RepID=A0A1M6L0G2_9CLOT|nr:hypothetical protein [Clostridium amylolyticum]SHJ64690.1 hypothetical protein SAMN05444401_3562 [Clostridium amylolyticum]
MSNEIFDKYFVIKREDVNKYLNVKDKDAFCRCIEVISDRRSIDDKKCNQYLVVNKDEPYAALVKKLILGEVTAREIIEAIARNCVAWDTSKDKREGLLPEVAVFTNPYLYEKLTGEKYAKYRAIDKFNIGED